MKQNSLLPFKKILVPYDGSRLAEKAFDYSIPIAKMTKESEIILLNTIEKILAPSVLFTIKVRSNKTNEDTTFSAYLNELQKEMKSVMVRKLELQKQRYEESSVKIRTVVLIGSPVNRIVKFSEEENIDLIIMGSKGSRGISKLLKGLGSVSKSVSEKVKCTIILIR
jgi:nucleotide-binding universal stress UspA family protein